MERLIKNLTEQLQKVISENPIEVDNDTYWRGVKIGLETAIEVAQDLKNLLCLYSFVRQHLEFVLISQFVA